jgi:GNAT superfamily N-acetyltransferase
MGERIVGGLTGATVWGWLEVKLLWVSEHHRGRGYGTRLLRTAEDEARRRGCHHAVLDTVDFQARGFYEALGYRTFASLADFPRGHSRIFFEKTL